MSEIKKVAKILPQRYPFMFIDKVCQINLEKGTIICLKGLTINEQFFTGHFPSNPVMPGVIIIEAMAQASIILYDALKPDIAKRKPDYFLGKVDARFFKPVTPGDQLILTISKEKILNSGAMVSGTATVNKEVVTKAKIGFSVKIKDE